MPDQTVEVTFTAPDTFGFVPDPVTMTAAGNVILRRSPASASWRFTGANVKNGDGQFSVTVPPSGEQAIIRDEHTSKGTWDYTVTVRDGSGTYTSPDPQIINTDPH